MGDSPTFYEFFAGGGMARAGLGEGWTCLLANDFDRAKAKAYRDNWGGDDLVEGDIGALTARDLPGHADLMWGSFPCQDLSLAGNGAGLDGGRSGTFHVFWDLVRELKAEGRAPRIVAVENVCGTLTSRGGQDFEIICRTYAEAGYRWGALVINAERFTPQSRPRLFVIGVREDMAVEGLMQAGPGDPFQPEALRKAVAKLPEDVRAAMAWWRCPAPVGKAPALADIIERSPNDVRWHNAAETERLLALMAPLHRQRVEAAAASGQRHVATVFRRTRTENGRKVQRAEARFDQAGCLRTPAGGSSRQTVLVIEGGRIRSRLLSGREMARLMGLPESYRLPARHSAACKLMGDGVAAPVVRWLAEQLFEPMLAGDAERRAA